MRRPGGGDEHHRIIEGHRVVEPEAGPLTTPTYYLHRRPPLRDGFGTADREQWVNADDTPPPYLAERAPDYIRPGC